MAYKYYFNIVVGHCRRQKICQANYKMPHQNLVANFKLMSLN